MKKVPFIILAAFILMSSFVYAEGPIEQVLPLDPIESLNKPLGPVQPVEEAVQTIDAKAVVVEASEAGNREDLYENIMVQDVKIEITSGKYKGEVKEIENHLSDNSAYNLPVEKGDKVIVFIEEYVGGYEVFISDYMRSNYIMYLAILGVILVLIVGRFKGLKSILSLGLTIGAVVYILLPQILKGANPIPISIAISIGVTIVTIFLVSGVNSKGISAILGTIAGVIIAGLISYFVGNMAHLTGLSAEEATMLIYIPQKIAFDFKNLLFSGIILGSLGAVMDVGMSIASSMYELKDLSTDISTKSLIKSGISMSP